MHPADLRFRTLWLRLFGPMFPAKPLRDGGVIQRRPKTPDLTLVDTGCGYKRLAWRYEGTRPEVIAEVIKPSEQHATRYHV